MITTEDCKLPVIMFWSCKLHDNWFSLRFAEDWNSCKTESFSNWPNCQWNLFPRKGSWERTTFWGICFWQTYLIGMSVLYIGFSETNIQWFWTSPLWQKESTQLLSKWKYLKGTKSWPKFTVDNWLMSVLQITFSLWMLINVQGNVGGVCGFLILWWGFWDLWFVPWVNPCYLMLQNLSDFG